MSATPGPGPRIPARRPRGGLSTPDNLRTPCWRCNRTKGAKLVS
ncbi:HNH endonuclease [Arthrobacter sp.]